MKRKTDIKAILINILTVFIQVWFSWICFYTGWFLRAGLPDDVYEYAWFLSGIIFVSFWAIVNVLLSHDWKWTKRSKRLKITSRSTAGKEVSENVSTNNHGDEGIQF